MGNARKRFQKVEKLLTVCQLVPSVIYAVNTLEILLNLTRLESARIDSSSLELYVVERMERLNFSDRTQKISETGSVGGFTVLEKQKVR